MHPKNGVIVEKSTIPSNAPSSKNNVFETIAVNAIAIICNTPTIPIPIVFPKTIVFCSVYVTSVSMIFEVFSVVIENILRKIVQLIITSLCIYFLLLLESQLV